MNVEIFNQNKLFYVEDSLVLLFEGHTIIPKEVYSKGCWLNIHSGVLPKWRGYSANSWALLNQEPLLGFTIHELEEDFDAGRILEYILIENSLSESYFDLRKELVNRLINRIPSLIREYRDGICSPPQQIYDLYDVRYCSKLRKSDGVIHDFGHLTDWLFNLGRLYINKDHSQLFLAISGKLVRIENLKKQEGDYLGFHSRVLKVSERWVLFKTLDSAIWCEFENAKEVATWFRKPFNSGREKI